MNKKMVALAVGFLCISALAMSTSKAKASSLGSVGQWRFDEGSGTLARDSSGNSNDGTLSDYQDTLLPQWVDGINNSALKFDGNNDFVIIPDSSSLDLSSNVTVRAWVYLPSGAHYADSQIVSKDAPNGGGNLDLGIHDDSGHIVVGLGTDGGFPGEFIAAYSDGTVSRNVWTYVAMTYNGSLVEIYINGILDSSHPWTGGFTTDNGMPLCIGAKNYQGAAGGTTWYGFCLNGDIDEVEIWNYAKSSQEIFEDYIPFLRPSPIPIWMEWYFWTTTAFGAIAVVLAFTTVYYRKKPSILKENTAVRNKNTQRTNRVCPKCGANLPADSKFCGKCGAALE